MIQILKAALFFFTVVCAIMFYIPISLAVLGFAADSPALVLRGAGLLCWAVGGAAAIWCVADFRVKGHGTPAPAAPTVTLVESGLYRYSRNPMYAGALLVVLGHVLWFQSWVLLMYWGATLLLFQGVIVFYEEPHLRRQFGAAYTRYCNRVPRWLI